MKNLRSALLALAFALSTGCAGAADVTPPVRTSHELPAPAAVQTWPALQDALATRRTVVSAVRPERMDTAGSRVFWSVQARVARRLSSLEDVSGGETSYDFPLGDSFRASRDLVVTQTRTATGLSFRAFDAASAFVEVASLQIAGSNTVPFAVEDTDVWYVAGERPTLYRWSLADAPVPQEVALLSDFTGPVHTITELTVSNGRAAFVADGVAWVLDPDAKSAKAAHTPAPLPSALSLSADGLLVRTAQGPFFMDLATGDVSDVSSIIASCRLGLEGAPEGAHLLAGDATLSGRSVFYVGQRGLFALDLSSGTIHPVLLTADRAEAASLRVPRVVNTEALYVIGISAEGEGRLYRVGLDDGTSNTGASHR